MSTVRSTSRLIRATAITILMISAIIVGHGSAVTAEAQSQKPSRPTGLVATAVQGNVQLSWNDPHDSTITHYKVFRRNISPGVQDTMQAINPPTPESSANSYTDSTAEPATSYKYKVTAVNADGQSRRSRVSTITTPPGQVQDVSATQQDADTDVVVTWTSLDAATKYQVERETTSNLSADPVVADVTAPVSSYSDSSTEYATEYLYRIRAGSDAGYGEWSDLDRITTHREPSTPAAPARVGLSEADAGSVVVTWQDPPGDEAVNGYRIYRKTVSTNTDRATSYHRRHDHHLHGQHRRRGSLVHLLDRRPQRRRGQPPELMAVHRDQNPDTKRAPSTHRIYAIRGHGRRSCHRMGSTRRRAHTHRLQGIQSKPRGQRHAHHHRQRADAHLHRHDRRGRPLVPVLRQGLQRCRRRHQEPHQVHSHRRITTPRQERERQQSNKQGRRLTSGPLRWARNEADLSPCTSHQHRRTSQRTGQPVDPRPAPAAHHVAANPTQLGRLTRILRCETGFTPLQNNGSQPWRGNVTSWRHGTVADQRGSRLFVGILL